MDRSVGNYISNYYSNVKLYKTLGSLIRDYRQCYKLSQENISELIGISVRELRNWETGRCRARIENLHDLSEATGIPMQACVALTANQPIWYSLHKRRFAYSFIEAQSLHHELFKYPERPGNDPTIKCKRISTDKHINMVLSCHSDIYGSVKPLNKDIIKKASAILPHINQIIFDSWGHYVGHTIWLPLNKEAYSRIKKQKSFETNFTLEAISDIVCLRQGWLLLFSLYVSSLNVMHYKLLNDARYLAELDKNGKYMVGIYSAMTEADELTKNIGLKIAGKYKQEKSERYNKLYESRLDILMSIDGPWSWLVKELNKNKSALIVDNNSGKTACDKSRINHQRLRQENRENNICNNSCKNNNIYNIACPNSNCRLYDIKDKGNIVSNGTYRRKGEKSGRRFLCKECGKSFCNRSGTMFYDLRSPEENVLKALMLLAEGKPLSHIKNLLGINFRTVRHWLESAAKNIKEINSVLKNELKMTEADINALMTNIKKNI